MADYKVNMDDERLTAIESEEKTAESELQNTYDKMIAENDAAYQDAIDKSNENADRLAEVQKEQTAFTIDKIEQQKEQAKKDYTKEQSGAYVDWQKQSNQYGADAEQMAANGLTNTGYSESSQVSMYNTYQNRVATARAAYEQVVMNYNNNIKEAQLANSAALAEIYSQAAEREMELILAQLTQRNSLLSDLANKKMQNKILYMDKWKTMLSNLQFEASHALDQQQVEIQKGQLQLQKDQFQFQKDQAAKAAQKTYKTSGKKAVTRKTTKSKGTNAGLIKSGQAKDVSVYDEGTKKKLTYSDVAATAAQLRSKGASKAEILQYLNTTVGGSNYKATTSTKQDLLELTSSYVGHSGR